MSKLRDQVIEFHLVAAPQTMARFWAKVDRSAGPHACWPWTACRDRAGYGIFQVNRSARKAHRIALVLALGEPVRGDVLHGCGNSSCCNPSHLRVGTAAENALDKLRHGTIATWERNGRAVLDRGQVARMRQARASGASYGQLISAFGVSKSQVSRIVNGVHWRMPEAELRKQGWQP